MKHQRRERRSNAWLPALALCWGCASVAACPSDAQARSATSLLQVQVAGAAPLALGAAELAALPAATLTQRQTVTAASGPATERSISYAGRLLRDVLLKAGFGTAGERRARFASVEAVATDGYRAVFSWGELFNTALGEQVLVIESQDGRPLDAQAGPLALRSLADLRPGPRHVRNLCALLVRP